MWLAGGVGSPQPILPLDDPGSVDDVGCGFASSEVPLFHARYGWPCKHRPGLFLLLKVFGALKHRVPQRYFGARGTASTVQMTTLVFQCCQRFSSLFDNDPGPCLKHKVTKRPLVQEFAFHSCRSVSKVPNSMERVLVFWRYGGAMWMLGQLAQPVGSNRHWNGCMFLSVLTSMGIPGHAR